MTLKYAEVAKMFNLINKIDEENSEYYLKVKYLLNFVYKLPASKYKTKSNGWLNAFYYYLSYGYQPEKAEEMTEKIPINIHASMMSFNKNDYMENFNKAIRGRMNNWRKLHGLPMRRKVRR